MKILSIGLDIADPEVTYASYGSPTSFLDFDLVLINASTIFSEYPETKKSSVNGQRIINATVSKQLKDDIDRRISEINYLIKLGRAVVFFLPPPEKCCWESDAFQSYEINIEKILPVKDFRLILAKGKEIEFRGGGAFKTYFDKMKDYHYYSAYMDPSVGQPFLFIRNTGKAIGSYSPTDSGFLLFLPSISIEDIESDKEHRKISKLLINSLKDLMIGLKNEIGEYNFPDWVHHQFLPNEKKVREDLIDAEARLDKIQLENDLLKKELFELEKFKVLLCGQGKSLEKGVGEVLTEIGFEVEFGSGNRTDLIIKHKGNVAVVEIKGVSKSAAEKHSRQLEQWISEYCLKNDTSECKGILIVNAFCGLPLNERVGKQVFPDTMIAVSRQREHCLITTTQLLGIFVNIRKDPEKQDKLIKELFSTIGVYSNFKNYKEFLEE